MDLRCFLSWRFPPQVPSLVSPKVVEAYTVGNQRIKSRSWALPPLPIQEVHGGPVIAPPFCLPFRSL